MDTDQIKHNIDTLYKKIDLAAESAGRKAEEITVVAVSKTVPPEIISHAIEAGIKLFGENYIQEGCAKAQRFSDKAIWHFIGHLQSNKAKLAVSDFDMIQSIDSVPLAQKISGQCKKINKTMPVLLQIHYGEEVTKNGFLPHEVEEAYHIISDLENISVNGVMTIPPFETDVTKNIKYFQEMRELSQKLFSGDKCILSMGMTDDFEIAIAEGSTMVRIGRALFGERRYR